jgi:hypothetical protein
VFFFMSTVLRLMVMNKESILTPSVGRRQFIETPTLSPTFSEDGSKNLFNAGRYFRRISKCDERCLGQGDISACLTIHWMGSASAWNIPTAPSFSRWIINSNNGKDHLVPEYQMGYDVTLFHDYTPADLVVLGRQRYTIHTWYLTSRLKLPIVSSTGRRLFHYPQVLLHMQQYLERCIIISS